MARLQRNLSSHPYFHIINHAVDGQDLFAADRDFERFEWAIAEHLAGHGVRVHAYVLMSNHYHLLVDLSACDDPSDAVGELQSRHAKYLNRRIDRHGPLFEKRFAAHGVSAGVQFHRVSRYIHANPAPITGRRAVAAYRWSSLPTYLGRRSGPAWLETEPLASEVNEVTYLASVIEVEHDDLVWSGERPPIHRLTISSVESAVDSVLSFDEGGGFEMLRRQLVGFVALDGRVIDIIDLAQRWSCSPRTLNRDATTIRTRRHDDPVLDRQIRAVMTELARSIR